MLVLGKRAVRFRAAGLSLSVVALSAPVFAQTPVSKPQPGTTTPLTTAPATVPTPEPAPTPPPAPTEQTLREPAASPREAFAKAREGRR